MPRHPARTTVNPADHADDTPQWSRTWAAADDLVTAKIVTSRYGAYRAVRTGDLPEPVVISGRMLWHVPTLEKFLLDRAAARAEARAATRAALQRNVG
ncbi:hypothetical protein [Neoroseomonas soli]|uniref:Uncharacterized protein n=1 Tax=Neoroseomonas soli TaxID=1081025 RepID=A0A9X9X280_9PROT|nr:hypothetical protein [Neoroseomonas soli]MBR0673509.1 hypothetical protein [Neoroseomonas soli]